MSTSTLYKKYLLVILLLAAAFSIMEPAVVGMLMQSMGADLHLSDTRLGVLSGIAYAGSYAVVSVPLARWADRGNRVTLLAIALVILSAAMAAYTIAGSFLQVLLIRVAVAVGFAGCLPPAVSLISDTFTRDDRPRAFATYALYGPLCVLIGYWAAGWLEELHGWRMTFLLLGLPGFVIAALVRLTVREPRVAGHKAAPMFAVDDPDSTHDVHVDGAAPPRLGEVMLNLWTNITLRHFALYWVVGMFFNAGIGQFQMVFLLRSFSLKSGELGSWLAVISGVIGLLGTYWGGAWASRYAANNERVQFMVAAVTYCGLAFLTAGVYLTTHRYVAFALLGLFGLMSSLPSGPLLAAAQTLAPPRMRATSYSLMNMLGTVIGLGLGPLVAGALSDGLRPWVGAESLRYASIAFCPGYLWCAWHLWRASKTVTRDMRVAHESCDDSALRVALAERIDGMSVV